MLLLGACGGTHPSWPASLPLRQLADVRLPGTPSRFDYQDVDPVRRRLVIAHLGASRIDVVDLDGLRLVATIEGVNAVHGVRVAADRGLIYASATGANSVVTIDEATGRVLARAPAGGYPDGLAYAAAFDKVYVSNESGGTETVIDARDGHRLGSVALGGEAGNVAYDPVSRRVFVDVQTRARLAIIDPGTDRVVDAIPLPGCHHDHGLLLEPKGRLAFVACDGNARLLVVNVAARRVIRAFAVGDRPDVLAFDSGLGRLYVASESGVVTAFGITGVTVLKLGQARLAATAHSVAVDPVTHRVFFPLQSVHGEPVLRIMVPQ
ncbi:MAG TPA: YncE family protein [Mycobacteriales bacterium]|nr:YncE family protein [Mycobacteriales bacterium]